MVREQLGPGMRDQAVVAIGDENPETDFSPEYAHYAQYAYYKIHNMHITICTICTICMFDNMPNMQDNKQINMYPICKIICMIFKTCMPFYVETFQENMHNNM